MKIGVVGAGSVGVGVCNYLLTLGSVRELVLYNIELDRAEGEILDFSHTNALTFSKNTKLVATNDFADLEGADIVTIAAGAQLAKGQTRLDVAEVNCKIGVGIAKEIEKYAPNAILIVVSNPCDLVAYFITANTGFHPSKVISSGCVVDTARLRSIVAKKVGIDPKNIFGYVIGEHGSHCFIPKSLITIAGQPADYYCSHNGYDPIDPDALLEEVKQVGFEILNKKHNTSHGVCASVFRVIQAISINEHSILPVGSLIQGKYGLHDVTLSLPSIISSNGIDTVLEYPFTSEEIDKLHDISTSLQNVITNVSSATGLSTTRNRPFEFPSSQSNLGTIGRHDYNKSIVPTTQTLTKLNGKHPTTNASRNASSFCRVPKIHESVNLKSRHVEELRFIRHPRNVSTFIGRIALFGLSSAVFK